MLATVDAKHYDRSNDRYLTLDWLEQGPLDSDTGQHFWRKGQSVCTPTGYPKQLLCSNPNCQDGGFEIGERIAALLASGLDNEQNSLVCRNMTHEDRAKRCPHTILYSIVCIYPYRKRRGITTGIRLTVSG